MSAYKVPQMCRRKRSLAGPKSRQNREQEEEKKKHGLRPVGGEEGEESESRGDLLLQFALPPSPRVKGKEIQF
ncbi:hypothetical protein M431DRAFT_506106 [Trichoderma harzianum CBS 226.95]|uniref:Uncharacterized protein n=1 Tax=Trichoderma harzianum CBS 226.95 TaxID=983964 RepID=A0A2T4AH47_TRIHA|nr:hypothetical protein M431DRAFT_506106 [Trichoderma harzianum CBS 226.95]PTB56353.1 hypothetical protein M431DRAFT_506106 [Trichoderma harzianum CBS 226.95]